MPDLTLSPGLTIHYLEYNPGRPETVLLLHGLGASGESWALQVPVLMEKGYRVLAPDARAFGHSSYPGGRMSVADLAMDMARLLEKLNAAPAHLVGISMGGAIALQLALDCPQLVRKLVLANTFACLRPKNPGVWLYFSLRFILLQFRGLPAQANAVAVHLFPQPEQAELRRLLVEEILQADPRGYRSAMLALTRFDARARLAQLHVPTLVITAEKDGTVPIPVQAQLAAGIPGARHEFIPRAGHAVTVDEPEIFNRLLVDFLAD